MASIFSSAENAYAWLGESDADCHFAMSYLTYPRDQRLHGNSMVVQYFDELLARPFWKRIWIVQELVLAKQLWLLCGNQIVA